MAEVNLPVSYKSQHDADSKISNNDCGPASLAMSLEFLSKKPTSVGWVLEKLGNPTGFTTIPQLIKLAQDLGFTAESKVDATFQELKKYLDRGLPVIVVGGYGYLTSTQDKNFKGSHIMLVVGYRDDDSVYVNDPDFWGDLKPQGDHHVYTFAEFSNFWRNDKNKEGNQPSILIVVSPKEATQAVEDKPAEPGKTTLIKVISKQGLNVRPAPATTTKADRSLPVGTELEVSDTVTGENIGGNSFWYKTEDGMYVWSGGAEVIKVTVNPPVVPTPAPVSNVSVPSGTDEYLQGLLAVHQMTEDILKAHGMLGSEPETISKPGLWSRIKEMFTRKIN